MRMTRSTYIYVYNIYVIIYNHDFLIVSIYFLLQELNWNHFIWIFPLQPQTRRSGLRPRLLPQMMLLAHFGGAS